ncbi:MAG: hypothetical protein WKF37_21340 [Bryobacteraceae bacterium]
MEIFIGAILLLVLGGLTLLMNPPNAWVDRATRDKKKKPDV